jgi:hypothetical protein
MIEETLDDEDVIEIITLAPQPPVVIVDLEFDEITVVRPPPPGLLVSSD